MVRMRTLAPLAGILLVASAASAAPAGIRYSVPLDWSLKESSPDREAYETSLDPSRRMTVIVRVVDTGGRSAEAWAMEESASLKDKLGVLVGTPREQFFDEIAWVYVDWTDPAKGERGRQYYLEGPGSRLATVSLVAEDETFREADASRFDGFLASFEWT